LCISNASFAQVADSIFSKISRTDIAQYQLNPDNPHVIYLKMSFASEIVVDQSILATLQNRTIQSIDIVYTDYPIGRNFDKLNTNRLKQMLKLLPELGHNKKITWNLVKQTECKNYTHAVKMFHGVAVHFEEEQLSPSTSIKKKEIEKVKKYVFDGTFKDSVVFKVIERNKKKWRNALVVSDWTGSVYPYSSQIVNWFRLNMKEGLVKHFVFFNDGDSKNDKEKKIGETGGIYFTQTNEISHVLEVMTQALQNGHGGDVPENDIEAVLAGIDKYKDISEIILIADNNSPVRDIRLTPKVTKPIRVILCGVENGQINAQYLNIAKFTGGSVHTIEEDIENLSSAKIHDILKAGSGIFRVNPKGFFFKVK
jgi:hypothetical protein